MCIWDGDTSQPEWETEAEWRGDEHPDEAESDTQPWTWPENQAGPEYWLNKKQRDRE